MILLNNLSCLDIKHIEFMKKFIMSWNSLIILEVARIGDRVEGVGSLREWDMCFSPHLNFEIYVYNCIFKFYGY